MSHGTGEDRLPPTNSTRELAKFAEVYHAILAANPADTYTQRRLDAWTRQLYQVTPPSEQAWVVPLLDRAPITTIQELLSLVQQIRTALKCDLPLPRR